MLPTRCSAVNWIQRRINRSQNASFVRYTIKGNTHNGIRDLIGIKRYKTVSRFGYYLSEESNQRKTDRRRGTE